MKSFLVIPSSYTLQYGVYDTFVVYVHYVFICSFIRGLAAYEVAEESADSERRRSEAATVLLGFRVSNKIRVLG